MTVQNAKIQEHDFLRDMYADAYFPNFLVDKIKAILIELCEEIERKNPQSTDDVLILTHAATEKINALGDEFEENGSELETVARDAMGDDFDHIVKAYGFADLDIEHVIAPREW